MESSVRYERHENVHGQDQQPMSTHSQHQIKYEGRPVVSYIANDSYYDRHTASNYALGGDQNRAQLRVDGSVGKANVFDDESTCGITMKTQAFKPTYSLDIQIDDTMSSKSYIDRLELSERLWGGNQAELSPLEQLHNRAYAEAYRMAWSKTLPNDPPFRNGRGSSNMSTWPHGGSTYEDFVQYCPQTTADVPTAPSTPSLTSLSSGSSSNSSVCSRSDVVHSFQRGRLNSKSTKKPSRSLQVYAMLESTKSSLNFDDSHEHLTRNEAPEHSYDAQTESSSSPEPTSEPLYEHSIASYDSSQSIATDDSSNPFVLRVDEPEVHRSPYMATYGSEAMNSIGSYDFERRTSNSIETIPVPTNTPRPGLMYPVSPIMRAPSRAVSDRSTSFSAVSPHARPLPVSPATTPVAYDTSVTYLAPNPGLVSYTNAENTSATVGSTSWPVWDQPIYTDATSAEHYDNSGLPTFPFDFYPAGNETESGANQFCFQGLDNGRPIHPNHSLLTVPNIGNRGWARAPPFPNRPLSNSESNTPRRMSLNSSSPAPTIGVDMASPSSCFTKQPVDQPQLSNHADNSVTSSQETSSVKASDQRQPPKRKQFQCIFCDVEYTTKNAWIRHETELHESPKKWQCPDCKATFLNESLFTRHHKQNHSCRDCSHANEAKIELPRKTSWACGFCADVFKDWGKRCDHVAQHFAQDNKRKHEWDFSNVISGLLTQKWVATAWQALLAKEHGTNAEAQPKFRWLSTNPSCLELQQDLEHGLVVYEGAEELDHAPSRLEQLVQTAYQLGTCENGSCSHDTPPVLPGDSESIANYLSTPPLPKNREADAAESSDFNKDDDTSSLDECSDDDYDTDVESEGLYSGPRPSTELVGIERSQTLDTCESTIIDAVVTEFMRSRFGPTPGIRSLAGSDQTSNSSAAGQSIGGASTNPSENGGNKKRSRGDEAPSERSPNNGHGNGNGDDPNKRQKINPSTKATSPKQGKRYACPYYKRDPDQYANQQSCPGPGWKEVHRVKDHLYKHHVRPIQCSRCWEVFADDSAFSVHQNAEKRCDKVEEKIAPGFDKEQEKSLRSKKRFESIKSSDDKWKHIYQILFPEDEHIPSPHYVRPGGQDPIAETPGSSAQFRMVEEYQLRALPDILKGLLRARLQAGPDSESPEIRQTKENIARILDDVFDEARAIMYQKWNQPDQQSSLGSPSLNYARTRNSMSSDNPQLLRNTMENLFNPPPPVPTSSSMAFTDLGLPQQWNHSSGPASDSGYFSSFGPVSEQNLSGSNFNQVGVFSKPPSFQSSGTLQWSVASSGPAPQHVPAESSSGYTNNFRPIVDVDNNEEEDQGGHGLQKSSPSLLIDASGGNKTMIIQEEGFSTSFFPEGFDADDIILDKSFNFESE